MYLYYETFNLQKNVHSNPPPIFPVLFIFFVSFVPVSGLTCVHLAAMQGNVDIMRQLVWNNGDINARVSCTFRAFVCLLEVVMRDPP